MRLREPTRAVQSQPEPGRRNQEGLIIDTPKVVAWSPVGDPVTVVGSRKRITNNQLRINPSATGSVRAVRGQCTAGVRQEYTAEYGTLPNGTVPYRGRSPR